MSFVLVSADCSCCKPEGRVEIYKLLTSEGWTRMSGEADDTTSIWLSALIPNISSEEAMARARDKFYSCFNPNCRPATVFHWSFNEMSRANVA